MARISVRVPDELEAELEAWRREQALDRLSRGSVTLSRAAELAGMSVWEFAQLATDRDVTWVASDHLVDDLGTL